MTHNHNNADSIAQFRRVIAEQKNLLKRNYEQLLAQDLSRQQWDGCFERNVLTVLEQTYNESLTVVKNLSFDSTEYPVHNGLSDLTKHVLTAFDGFVDEFLLFVVDKHRTSCALSNFPDEHKPDNTYINHVRRGIAALWQNFALTVNDHFLDCR